MCGILGDVLPRRHLVRGSGEICERRVDTIHDLAGSGGGVEESGGTYHLDILFFILGDILNVDVGGILSRERLIRGRDSGEEGLDAREHCGVEEVLWIIRDG